MLESRARSHYQRWLVEPIAKQLHRRFHANHITLLAVIVGVLVLPLLYWQHPGLAAVALLLSGYFDTLDGTLARLGEHTSDLGSCFDIVGDRLVEAMVILGLFVVSPDTRGLACLLMFASILLCITSFLVVGIFTMNQSAKSFHYSEGLIERAEAFIFFVLMILWPIAFFWLTWTFVILVNVTTCLRLYDFYRYTKTTS
jgi:phosphatidylglycerophosphate synthase